MDFFFSFDPNFEYFQSFKVRGQWISRDNFFFSLPASLGVLFYILSAGITAIKGK